MKRVTTESKASGPKNFNTALLLDRLRTMRMHRFSSGRVNVYKYFANLKRSINVGCQEEKDSRKIKIVYILNSQLCDSNRHVHITKYGPITIISFYDILYHFRL